MAAGRAGHNAKGPQKLDTLGGLEGQLNQLERCQFAFFAHVTSDLAWLLGGRFVGTINSRAPTNIY